MASILGWWAEKETETGVIAPATKPAKISATGQVSPSGAIIATTQRTKVNLGGAQQFTGVMGASTKKPAFAGMVKNNGTMSASVKKTIANVAGGQRFTGSIGAALKKAVASLQGAQYLSGTMPAKTKPAKANATGTIPGVTLNSVGTFSANGGNGNNVTPTITIAPGSNTRLYCIVIVTHNAWMNSYNTGKPAASSNVNGAFTQIDSGWLGDSSGWRQGSIWILEYIGPTAGAHTVTVDCSAGQGLNGIAAQLIAFDGIISRGTIQKTTNPPNSGAADLTVSALADGNLHLVIQTDNAVAGVSLTNDWPSDATRFVNQTPSWTIGDARSMRCCYVNGNGSSRRFLTGTNSRYATLCIPLLKI